MYPICWLVGETVQVCAVVLAVVAHSVLNSKPKILIEKREESLHLFPITDGPDVGPLTSVRV